MSDSVVLVIEDQKAMADLLQSKIAEETGLRVLVAYNFTDAKKLIESDLNIVVCLTDLNLPDAEEAATVPLLHQHHISTVVLTANYTEETRLQMFKERVADYVIKDGLAAIDYAVKTVVTLIANANLTVWVLSKQSKHSKKLLGLLKIHRYKASMFDSAKQLLATMNTAKAPDLLLINETAEIDDLPVVELIQNIRQTHNQSRLPILVSEKLSANDARMTEVIKLMKYGVNDFYNLNFTAEEFFVRLNLNIKQALNYKEIERISQTDSMTGLANRRCFFEKAKPLFLTNSVFAVMADIDFFKKVNDRYGHDKGDEAIVFAAQVFESVFADFLVARFGGEEFCVVGTYQSQEEVADLCEQVRSRIESESSTRLDLPLTISLGLAFGGYDSHQELDALLSDADKALYEAKNHGRNRVSTLI